MSRLFVRYALVPKAVFLCSLLVASVSYAHELEGNPNSLLTGFLHPLTGLDHMLAMVAVGIWGAQLGAPAIWVLPVTFPIVMAFGGVAGLIGIPMIGIELGIALSSLVLGVSILSAWKAKIHVALLAVGLFAIFHGYAHGAELPDNSSGVLYSIGFVVATGLLHATGVLFGLMHKWPTGQVVLRGAGVLVAVFGVYFVWNAVS